MSVQSRAHVGERRVNESRESMSLAVHGEASGIDAKHLDDVGDQGVETIGGLLDDRGQLIARACVRGPS